MEKQKQTGNYGFQLGIRPSRKRVTEKVTEKGYRKRRQKKITEKGDRKRVSSVSSRQSQFFIKICCGNLKNIQPKIEEKSNK